MRQSELPIGSSFDAIEALVRDSFQPGGSHYDPYVRVRTKRTEFGLQVQAEVRTADFIRTQRTYIPLIDEPGEWMQEVVIHAISILFHEANRQRDVLMPWPKKDS